METLTIKSVSALIRAIKAEISDDYRAYPDEDEPGVMLTIGSDAAGRWSYQTGDNSFMGGAYGYPYWGVVAVYRDSNSRDLAREAIEQIRDIAAECQAMG